jgi:hypothetical protein
MITKEFKFKNGDEVAEKITGFKGVITGTCFYLTGCNQYLITAKTKEGKEPIALWYDEGRIEFVKKEVFETEDVASADNGCDIPPLMGVRGA